MQIYRYTPRNAWGINNFNLYMEAITGWNPVQLKDICKWLDVSEKTMSRWRTGATRVPNAVCYALFHESKWGRGLAETTAFNDRAHLFVTINALEQKVRTLEADNAALRAAAASAAAVPVAANDALYLPRDAAPITHPKRRHAPTSNFRISRRAHVY